MDNIQSSSHSHSPGGSTSNVTDCQSWFMTIYYVRLGTVDARYTCLSGIRVSDR